MKNKNVNFKNIKDVLSRDEMKSITGGSIMCLALAYFEIPIYGACSGSSVRDCLIYCEVQGFTGCNCS
jgi:hypothetical protein